jgi:drug/metabolite transporter (DMT)-like permease
MRRTLVGVALGALLLVAAAAASGRYSAEIRRIGRTNYTRTRVSGRR